jgi:hypothetical protein
MESNLIRRPRVGGLAGFALALAAAALAAQPAPAGARTTDPAQVVPIDKISAEHRESVAEVIRDHTLHRKSAPETFPCHPKLYLSLLNEPTVTLALWKDLSTSAVSLRQVGPNRYDGSDGSGASGSWEFVYRSPKLHVLLGTLSYSTPRGTARLDARIVLVVHTGFFKEVNGDQWVQHDVEAFVKVDSKGWKAVARTVRPIIEGLLEDQVREAGWFVSLMGRLVASYPNWACQVTMSQGAINPGTRQRFRDVVLQARRPDASTGRPALAENLDATARTR